ncbi:hypothetical protein OR16_21141 [Cupriavidus basilensis OR16]|uniref:DUF1484 domain-containing protein n=1 Tax=Cupriavidus basilensis OR16 TaxID=1127483 RepID=H1S8C5_9BURK|nr:DUF1484 family protein [Cupriavidus basilensis]EHP41245.1 hypothetical protein OR16_21141 [Cupriavidus basilensis OR16]
MSKSNRSAHTLALFRQRDLIAQLLSQINPTNKRAKAQLGAAVTQIHSLGDCIRETTQDSCSELLDVSAGLDGILKLLDLQRDKSPEHYSLYCLLTPLKRQLDDALSNVHDML